MVGGTKEVDTHLVVRTRVARVVAVVDLAFVADHGEKVVLVGRLWPEGRIAVEEKEAAGVSKLWALV